MSTFNLTIIKSRGECKIQLQARDSELQSLTPTEFNMLFREPYRNATEVMDKVPFIQKVSYSSSID